MLLKDADMKRLTKGFTLLEMLLVVAIIAVLISIAVPVFANKLTEAMITTNRANLRSASVQILSQLDFPKTSMATDKPIYEAKYDIVNQKIVGYRDPNWNRYIDGVQRWGDNTIGMYSKDGMVQWMYFRMYLNLNGKDEYYYIPFYDETKVGSNDVSVMFSTDYYDALDHFNVHLFHK